MDDQNKIAKDVFDKSLNDSQYNVGPVPYHVHNGSDSPVVATITGLGTTSSNSLIGDVVLAAGSNVTVSESGQTITVAVPVIGITTSFNYQVFITPGSGLWTKPAGASATSMVLVECWGAGGAGGGANNTGTSDGGAGGGGEYSFGIFRAGDLNSTVALVVGTGGTAGTGSPCTAGGDGVNTTFAVTLVVARGGKGGVASTAGTGTGGNGVGYFPGTTAGASADALDMFSSGAGGTNTQKGNAGGNAYKGGGGGSQNGATPGTSAQGGAGGSSSSGNSNGGDGNVPGGGGGAAHQNGAGNHNGGAGARGEVRVTTYF